MQKKKKMQKTCTLKTTILQKIAQRNQRDLVKEDTLFLSQQIQCGQVITSSQIDLYTKHNSIQNLQRFILQKMNV